MSEIKQAAESVRHLAKSYAAVIHLGQVLDKVGDIEIAADQTEARLRKAREGEAAANEAYEAARARLAEVQRQADERTAAAQAEAENAIETANRTVSEMVERAREEAERIKAEAEDQVARKANEIAEAQTRLGTIEQNITNAHAELERITNEIAQLRARIG